MFDHFCIIGTVIIGIHQWRGFRAHCHGDGHALVEALWAFEIDFVFFLNSQRPGLPKSMWKFNNCLFPNLRIFEGLVLTWPSLSFKTSCQSADIWEKNTPMWKQHECIWMLESSHLRMVSTCPCLEMFPGLKFDIHYLHLFSEFGYSYPPVIKHGNGKLNIYRWCS